MGNLGQKIADALQPKDTRPTHEWASDGNVELFPPVTRTGIFDSSSSRHFIPILDALDDERTREVNILKPLRSGGSLIGDIHLCSAMARNPGGYLNVFQTEPEAKNYFFDRIEKTLKGCSQVAIHLPYKYEWSELRLNTGATIYTGGPALSNLQSKGVRYLRLDECWMYPAGRIVEAEGRVGDYLKMEMSKILRISQAGPYEHRTLDECEWHRAYTRGTMHEWEVQCEHCQKYFEPVFSGQREDGSFWGITWEHFKKQNGDWDLGKCCATVRFECPHCGKPLLDCPKTKSEWNRTGRYKLIGEDNKRRVSFHFECVIDFPWADLVELWLDAANAYHRGDIKPKLQFYQKRRAIFKDESSLLRTGLHLSRVPYEINSDWIEEKSRFATFDRQEEDLYWWTVRAWSENKSRRLGFGRCFGEGDIKDVATKYKITPNHVGIDSGFLPKGDRGVYAMCCRNGWVAMKGDRGYEYAHRLKGGRIIRKSYAPLSWGDPEIGTKGEGRRYSPLVIYSKAQMNQIVQTLIDSKRWEEPIEGENKDTEEEYQAQMSARRMVEDFDEKTGQKKSFWKESKNDHARDLANEQVLFAILSDLISDPVIEKLSRKEEQAVEVK
jgi:hypothetical protein